MKKFLIPAGAVVALALLVTGCENDGGVSARKKEKATAYATFRPWQKTLIEAGTIARDFTPEMVYVAMGNPDKVEIKEFPEGKAEMWTYTHYYPNVDAIHGFQNANFSTESAYQPQRALLQTNATLGDYANDFNARNNQVPLGMDKAGGESLYKAGGPQGGTIEPSDLRSYTIKVLFASGKVIRFGANPNVH